MWKRLRRYYWLTKSFVERHHKLIFRTIGLVILISISYVLISNYIPAPRTVTRVGIVGKFTQETLPQAIQEKVSDGLVKLGSDGDPQPALASSWTISEDGLNYTFTLNEKLKWHDGSTLKPTDIVYNFKEVTTSYDNSQVTFNLQEPFAPFFQAVSKPILKDGKIGVKVFRIQKITANSGVLQEVVLVSEKEKYIYKFFPTESSAITAFHLGEIDIIDNILYAPPSLDGDPTTVVTPNYRNSQLAVLFFNNNDSLLTSKSARQGLAYAIKDKSFGRTRALSPITEDSWAYNPLVKDYEFDATKANTLFYTDIDKSRPPSIELKTTLNYLDVAEQIASDWREVLGIEVTVKVVTNISSDYQALLTDYEPPKDPDQYTIWHSTQPTNFTKYSNLKVDKLLEDGRRTLDKKLRTEIYQDFQRFLLEDSPAVFLFRTSSFTVSRQSVTR